MNGEELSDWQRAPNIAGDPEVYELENEALERDGRLDAALWDLAPWSDTTILDIGCGTGFWLERYAAAAAGVIGVEPDPSLVQLATRRARCSSNISVRRGSAEHLPVADASVELAHARFAYFFGPGSERGLDEVARVLDRGGLLLAIDNSWSGGDFARLLRASDVGNATIDPDVTDRWWSQRGAVRHEVEGGWTARSLDELDRILRIEFPADVVDAFTSSHVVPTLSYRFAVYEWRP